MARKKSKANYFTKETEDWIVVYNNESDPEVRSKIYEVGSKTYEVRTEK